MGLFNRKEGGLIDVIRCDEKDYLIWKWHPSGNSVNSTNKENAIRYSSSLRVKDGEVAVFVYKQNDGTVHDYILGPHDDIIKTSNFPVLSNIVGLAFGGSSPFQAEIYFINLAGNIQIKFAVPYFDVFDPRFLDFAVPMAVRGTITFNITDYKGFIKLNRLINFELEDFKKQIKDAVTKYIKGIIVNIPADNAFPVLQMERKILEINQIVEQNLRLRMENDFGVNLKAVDIASIEPDKESEGYAELRKVTVAQTAMALEAQMNVNVKNMADMQAINATNMEETLRIQREEAQRAQRLQSETNFIGAHALDQQTSVLQTAAENLGQMGHMDGGSGGFNPAGVMTGMMLGGTMGQQMSGMMNTVGQAMNQSMNTPPPPPQVQYTLNINGQNMGPYNLQQLQQMVKDGQVNVQTYVWRQGMAGWEFAGNVQELSDLFETVPPPLTSETNEPSTM